MVLPSVTLEITFSLWPWTGSHLDGSPQDISAYSGPSAQRQAFILFSLYCLNPWIEGLATYPSISMSSNYIHSFYNILCLSWRDFLHTPESPWSAVASSPCRCLQLLHPSASTAAGEESWLQNSLSLWHSEFQQTIETPRNPCSFSEWRKIIFTCSLYLYQNSQNILNCKRERGREDNNWVTFLPHMRIEPRNTLVKLITFDLIIQTCQFYKWMPESRKCS